MANLIQALADIGEVYLQEEAKLNNAAFGYDNIKVFLCDIENKTIEPSMNVEKDDLVLCRNGSSAASPWLFPNTFFSTEVDKLKKDILNGTKTMLSNFSDEEIAKNEILSKLSKIDENFFDSIGNEIKKLTPLEKIKGKNAPKNNTFFSLSYKGKPVSAYFLNLYEEFLNKEESNSYYGYDILTNSVGVGADADLAFCSVNDLPATMKEREKARVLPVNGNSAKKIKTGFKALRKKLSHNFSNMKIAIIPTIFDKKIELKDVLEILENTAKGNIKDIEFAEEAINYTINAFLEDTAREEGQLPILNTILFYTENQSSVVLNLTIDDILPSYISLISNLLALYGIKAFFFGKEDNIIFLDRLFDNRLEIMNFLLSRTKFNSDTMIEKYSNLILYGSGSGTNSIGQRVEWSKYFNNYYKDRSIDVINRYQNFFNDAELLSETIYFKKEIEMEATEKQDQIKELIYNNVNSNHFVAQNSILKSAYLLGVLSSAIIDWQLAVNKGSSYFSKWLDRCGAINKDKLPIIWEKCDETIKKLRASSGFDSKNINIIKEALVEILPQALMLQKSVKSSYVTLAFAIGGSDFKELKNNKNN